MAGLIKYLELSKILNNPYDLNKIIPFNIPNIKEMRYALQPKYINNVHFIKQHQKVSQEHAPLIFIYSINLT